MAHRFQKHYTREEARALLPRLRQDLDRLNELRHRVTQLEQRLGGQLTEGRDIGGSNVNECVKSLVEMRRLLMGFHEREIQIKDLERGLIDFPALVGGREVFLCWEKDEDDIEYWHDLDAGYAGRERLA
jgi:hypothetical protein